MKIFRSSRPEVFLGKSILKICSKFSGEHPCRGAISIKLLRNFMKWHFGMGDFLYICCIFSEHLFQGTPLNGCIWILSNWSIKSLLSFILSTYVQRKPILSTYVQRKQIFHNFMISLPNKAENPFWHSSKLRLVI